MYVYAINDECYCGDYDYDNDYDSDSDNSEYGLEEILEAKCEECMDISSALTRAGCKHDLTMPELCGGGGKLRVYYTSKYIDTQMISYLEFF